MVGARLLTVGVRLQTSRGMASALVTLDLGFLGGCRGELAGRGNAQISALGRPCTHRNLTPHLSPIPDGNTQSSMVCEVQIFRHSYPQAGTGV